MRAVVQRVSEAKVDVDSVMIGQIGSGLLILVGIEEADTKEDVQWLAGKIISLRIFGDNDGLMNRSIQDLLGDILVVSQFTLHASYKKGTRPSFIKAAKPEMAHALYEDFCKELSLRLEKPVATGKFGANMKIHLVNDGPVTILIDTKNKE
jgi:D-aminoacyl-tRNA deacylase